MADVGVQEQRKPQLSKAELEFLRHMCHPWWNIINKQSFYVRFGTEKRGICWAPKGPTGATVYSLMRKGLIDFAPKPGVIGKLVLATRPHSRPTKRRIREFAKVREGV